MSVKEKLEAVMAQLQQDMSLSEDQSSKIRGFVESHMAQRREIKARHGDNKMARKAEIKPLRKQLRQDIGGVLNADQKAVFRNNKEQYKQLLRG